MKINCTKTRHSTTTLLKTGHSTTLLKTAFYPVGHISLGLSKQPLYHIVPNTSRSVLWTDVCVPSKFLYWTLNPRCDGIRQWGLQEVITSWGWSPQEWDWCPQWERQQRACFLPLLSAMWGHNKNATILKPGRGPSPRTQPYWHPNPRLPVSRTGRCKFLLFKPLSLWISAIQQELTRTEFHEKKKQP